MARPDRSFASRFSASDPCETGLGPLAHRPLPSSAGPLAHPSPRHGLVLIASLAAASFGAASLAACGSGTNANDSSGGSANGETGGTSGGAGATGGATAGQTGGATDGTASAGTATTGSSSSGGSDAGTSAATSGLGGPSLCANHNYLLCEGFEDTPVGTTPPAGWEKHGDVSIVDTDAARGTHSLAIAAAPNGERRIYYTMASQFGSGHWGRIFYKVQVPVPDPFVHSTLVALFGNGPTVGPAEYRVVDTVKNEGAGATHQFLYNVQPSGAEFSKQGPYWYRFDGKWHCVEWYIDGAVQSYHFYYNNTEVVQMAIDNGAGNYGTGDNHSDIPMSFSDLRVGWNNYQDATPGFVAFIDEIAIDTNRIGCTN